MESSLQDNSLSYLKLLFESGDNNDAINSNIAEIFPAIIYVYNVDSKKITFVNKSVTESLGYSIEDIHALDDDVLRFVFEDDVQLVRDEIEKCTHLNDSELRSFKLRFNPKEGNFRYFRTQSSVLRRDKSGRVLSILFIAQDISEQVEARDEANLIKELFTETEQLLRFGTFSWNIENDVVTWSDGLYVLMGYDLANKPDVTNQLWFDHVSAEDRPKVENSFRSSVSEKKELSIQFEIIPKNGSPITVYTRTKLLFDEKDNVTKLIGVSRDITEQNRIHKDLIDYRQMMLDKEQFLGSGSWEYVFATNSLSWSEGKYRLFGYNPSNADNLPAPSPELYHKHLTENEFQKITKAWEDLSANKSENTWDYELTALNGERKYIQTYGRMIFDQFGNKVKVIGASRDITRMRNYEESLKIKLEELDRSNKELEEFAYIASHDLQEPLRKITAFSERLKDRSRGELGEEGTIYLDRMMVATENMRILIDNLLEFSRTSRHNHEFRDIDLNTVLKDVNADLELKIEETDASIVSDPLPTIEGIPTQIRQLVTNLVTNAIKFRKHGERPVINFTAGKVNQEDKTHFRLRPERAYVSLIVRDEGIGFEQEYAQKIFQIFQRLHGKSEYPGSGIGLAICKKIAENHGGLIYANGTPGKGASFTILLPEKQS